ncbi:MAG: acetate kinase [Corynebacterium sp.]|nr:acetate kinase [Corynebacterium sp.]
MYALVINSGSSSVKFQVVNPNASATDTPLVSGLVEQIGEPMGAVNVSIDGKDKIREEFEIPNHTAGLKRALEIMSENGVGPGQVEIVAVGHRVVHGGRLFSEPVVITKEIEAQIEELIPLAPLHNPANLDGIRVAQSILPDIPHVAVFDTAFFNGMPQSAALYAIDREVAEKYNVRRYGFHGTSHEFVSGQVPELLGKDAAEVNQITLHLGNGASAAAVRAGEAIDTSMGLTPLAGLVMGTRSGDVDPGIIFHLARQADMNIDELDTLLNKQSGVKGLCGVNDFRVLRDKIDENDADATLAYEVYITQLRRFIGSYMIALGRVDAISFTAGVGENDNYVREDALAGLEMYGIKIDAEKNAIRASEPRLISTEDSAIKVFVVPTNEELAIAQKAAALAEQA